MGKGHCSQSLSPTGIVVNFAISHLIPPRTATYLGMTIKSPSLRAFHSPERVLTLLSQLGESLSCRRQNVIAWQSLLGHLSSLSFLVPGGRPRMWSLQLVLCNQWDFKDESIEISWTPSNELDLLWWSDINHFLQGVSLEVPYPNLLFWSDALDHGWGTSLHDHFISGCWSVEECEFSINLRELRSIRLGLYHFRHFLRGLTVGLFTDNTTALSYIKKRGSILRSAQQGGATPPPLGGIVGAHSAASIHHGDQERSRRFPELSSASSGLQMDPCSGCGERIARDVAGHHRPFRHGPQLLAPSLLLAPELSHGSGHGRVFPGVGRASGVCVSTFHPYSPGIKQTLDLQGDSSDPHRPILASEGVVPGAPESLSGSSGAPSFTSRSVQTASLSLPAPEPPCALPSCVATVQRFARHLGLSRCVANQLSLC